MEVSQWIVIEYFTHHRFECGLKTALNDMRCVPWYLPKPQGHAPPCRSDIFHFIIALVKSQNNVNDLNFLWLIAPFAVFFIQASCACWNYFPKDRYNFSIFAQFEKTRSVPEKVGRKDEFSLLSLPPRLSGWNSRRFRRCWDWLVL